MSGDRTGRHTAHITIWAAGGADSGPCATQIASWMVRTCSDGTGLQGAAA